MPARRPEAWLSWSLPAVSQTDYLYEIADGQVTIGQYIGPGGAVTVPDQIEGLPVTAIGPRAFQHQEFLTSVRVPDSVREEPNFCP